MGWGGGEDPRAGAHGSGSPGFRWGWSVDEGGLDLVGVSHLLCGSGGVPWGGQRWGARGGRDLVAKGEGMAFPSPGALGWR